MNMHAVFLMLTVFLAAVVEAVEMATIVLGVGMTRGWLSTLFGGGVGFILLAGIVGGLGPLLVSIPIGILRMIVGMLLLLFGMQWLRKSTLRISRRGFTGGSEEEESQEQQEGALGQRIDWTAFALSFKGVFLEGLEIAFIVVTFGAATNQVLLGAYAAVGALVLVTGITFFARKAMQSVPGHVLKYVVGILLTTYGTFWAAEGAKVAWPGGDLSIVGLLVLYTAASFAAVGVLRKVEQQTSTGGSE